MIIFENETVYSIVARFHIVSGSLSANETNRFIFNKSRKRIHSYLPSGIVKIGQRLSICPEQLLNYHTLFGLYSPFISTTNREKLRQTMMSQISCCPANLVNSKSGINLPYNRHYCAKCVEHDIYEFGVPYWHLEHQIPGVKACYRHAVNLRLHNVSDFEQAQQYIIPIETFEEVEATTLNIEFALFCHQFLDLLMHSTEHFNPYSAYSIILSKLALKRGANQLAQKKISEIIRHKWSAELDDFQSVLNLNAIANVLRGNVDCSTHPLKHFIIAFSLFESASAYFESGILHGPPKCSISKKKVVKPQIQEKPLHEEIIKQLKEGRSLNQISSYVHCGRGAIKIVGKINGLIAYSSIDRAVWRKALQGEHRYNIASALNISTGYVEQVISSFEGLVAWRQDIRQLRSKEENRNTIASYILKHPNHNRKSIKANCSKAFFWLYANDRPWLELTLPIPATDVVNPRVDWHRRDKELAQEVKGILAMHPLLNSREAIDRKLGNHGWLTKKRHLLPLTMLLLDGHFRLLAN